MEELKLVDYSDSSSEDEILDSNYDIGDKEFSVNLDSNLKKIAVVSPLQQNAPVEQMEAINFPQEDINQEEEIIINTQSPASVHSNYDIIEINSSPVESPNIINVSSDSDTISYHNHPQDDIEDDLFLQFDEVFSNKSCTSGNKNHTIFKHIIFCKKGLPNNLTARNNTILYIVSKIPNIPKKGFKNTK